MRSPAEVAVRAVPNWHVDDLVHVATRESETVLDVLCMGIDTPLAWDVQPEGTAPNCIACISRLAAATTTRRTPHVIQGAA